VRIEKVCAMKGGVPRRANAGHFSLWLCENWWGSECASWIFMVVI